MGSRSRVLVGPPDAASFRFLRWLIPEGLAEVSLPRLPLPPSSLSLFSVLAGTDGLADLVTLGDRVAPGDPLSRGPKILDLASRYARSRSWRVCLAFLPASPFADEDPEAEPPAVADGRFRILRDGMNA